MDVMIRTVPPMLGNATRFLAAGAILWGIGRLRGRSAGAFTPRRAAGAACAGVLLVAGGPGLITVAERSVPTGVAALVIASAPLWTAVFGWFIGMKPTRRSLLATVIGFCGVALLFLPAGHDGDADMRHMALLLVAAISLSLGSLASVRLPSPPDAVGVTAVQMIAGGAVLAVAAVATGEVKSADIGSFSALSIGAVAYLLVVGSVVGSSVYVWLLKNSDVSRVMTFAYVTPVVAVMLGWSLLSEPITLSTVLASIVIVSSVAVIVTDRSGRSRASAGSADAVALLSEPSAHRPSGGIAHP